MRAALTNLDGLVINVIELPDEHDPGDPDRTAYEPPEDLVVVELDDDQPVGPGWTRTGNTWSPPAPTEAPPSPVDALQAQLDELTDILIETGAI